MRKSIYRLLAILLGILPLVVLEGALFWLDLPRRPPPIDPYVDLQALKPVLVPSQQAGVMEIARERLNLFRSVQFPLKKPSDTFRIFALGGSTTQGEPYSTETAFPKWMQLQLQAVVGNSTTVEVINLGGLSYASYRVLAILQESLKYDPDLIVIYTGQNEYLEKRTYQNVLKPSWPRQLSSQLSSLRSVQLVRSILGNQAQRPEAASMNRTQMQAEVDALLDYQGGLADYHRGDAWMAGVVEHFRWNVEQMVRLCQSRSTPVMLVVPVNNLLDCPPIKFEMSPSLSPDEFAQAEMLWQQARDSANPQQAKQAAERVLRIDPEHAGANYLLGQTAYANAEYDQSLRSLTIAKDCDVCPLRAPTNIQQTVLSVADDYSVPYLDASDLFAGVSPHGIVGRNWLVDHIHPTVEGHQLLGQRLAELALDAGILVPRVADWESHRDAAFREHLGSLGEDYFHRGKQRLEGLLLWTQGRAKKVRSKTPEAPPQLP